jgi:hypothetical protein
MEQSDLLRFVASVLERLAIPYFFTGSVVTIFYGEPRFTNDIDVVVALSQEMVDEFCRQFPHDEFYVSAEAAHDAVRRQSMFNIIQPRTGLKVDVMIPPPSDFNQSRFGRARRVRAGDQWEASFSAPDDAILKKMEFYRAGGSDKHLRDIAGVLRTSPEEVDRDYIERWAERLGLSDVWRTILDSLNEP